MENKKPLKTVIIGGSQVVPELHVFAAREYSALLRRLEVWNISVTIFKDTLE